MRWLWFAAIAGCSYNPTSQVLDSSTSTSDTPVVDPDTAPDGPQPIVVAHVPMAVTDLFAGTAAFAFDNAVINTGDSVTLPAMDLALPDGARFVVSDHDGPGPELAILEVDSLVITGTLRVVGERPLVVIARTTIAANVIDASAEETTPGAGAYRTRSGPGTGGDGGESGDDQSGGGGGGFGTAGIAGQQSGASTAGGPGASYGTPELTRLEGGSLGGRFAPACGGFASAGAGGGAIQLYAGTSIRIDGSVRVNGGGGQGGLNCSGTGTSGAGGGSGGAIYLQTNQVLGAGLLLAQGGGGGGGMDISTQNGGGDGIDGLATIGAAPGGVATGTGIGGEDNSGGAGGFRDASPPALTGISGQNSGNGGGGGGAVGRIVVRAATPGNLSSSPLANNVAP